MRGSNPAALGLSISEARGTGTYRLWDVLSKFRIVQGTHLPRSNIRGHIVMGHDIKTLVGKENTQPLQEEESKTMGNQQRKRPCNVISCRHCLMSAVYTQGHGQMTYKDTKPYMSAFL